MGANYTGEKHPELTIFEPSFHLYSFQSGKYTKIELASVIISIKVYHIINFVQLLTILISSSTSCEEVLQRNQHKDLLASAVFPFETRYLDLFLQNRLKILNST